MANIKKKKATRPRTVKMDQFLSKVNGSPRFDVMNIAAQVNQALAKRKNADDPSPFKESTMANAEKKKAKLAERIKSLEDELRLSLQKKSSSAAEINMPGKMQEIARLKRELAGL